MREYVEQRDGWYYVAGSRVSLASIVYEYRDGAAAETIQQNFPTLTLEQVHGAIACYWGTVAKRTIMFESLRLNRMSCNARLSRSTPLCSGGWSRPESEYRCGSGVGHQSGRLRERCETAESSESSWCNRNPRPYGTGF
jgi:uncharacterized protein (DUF433 family)